MSEPYYRGRRAEFGRRAAFLTGIVFTTYCNYSHWKDCLILECRYVVLILLFAVYESDCVSSGCNLMQAAWPTLISIHITFISRCTLRKKWQVPVVYRKCNALFGGLRNYIVSIGDSVIKRWIRIDWWIIGRHLEGFRHGQLVISGFRREVDENCDLLGHYAASSDNFLPTFRDTLGPKLRDR